MKNQVIFHKICIKLENDFFLLEMTLDLVI